MSELDAEPNLTDLGKAVAKALNATHDTIETWRDALRQIVGRIGLAKSQTVFEVALAEIKENKNPVAWTIIKLEVAKLVLTANPKDEDAAVDLGYSRARLAALTQSATHSEEELVDSLLHAPVTFTNGQKTKYLKGLLMGSARGKLSQHVFEVAFFEQRAMDDPSDARLVYRLRWARAKLQSVRSKISLGSRTGAFRTLHDIMKTLPPADPKPPAQC